ncbi:hypothetical protein PENTCL1PPCAC_21979, partial [Pristionchus entomophagus]
MKPFFSLHSHLGSPYFSAILSLWPSSSMRTAAESGARIAVILVFIAAGSSSFMAMSRISLAGTCAAADSLAIEPSMKEGSAFIATRACLNFSICSGVGVISMSA